MRNFDYYLNAAGRAPLLTPVQEIELSRLYRSWRYHPDYPNCGERLKRRAIRARDRLIESNMRLVVSVAKRYIRRLHPDGSYEFSDLIQDGNVALMTAVEKFDPERGYKFSTYSYWWIKQGINRGLETRQRLIRAPHTVAEQLQRLSRVTRQLSLTLGRMPTPQELADGLGMSLEEFQYMMRIQARPSRLDLKARSDMDTNSSLVDLIADDRQDDMLEQTQMELHADALKEAWVFLDPEERDLVSRRYGINGHHPHSYREIQETTGTSGERCRQRVHAAEKKLQIMVGTRKPVSPSEARRRAVR